jgi:hypothetical protein
MRTLSNDQYDALLMQSDVIEKDRHGIKVVRLPDGSFLKTFWYRHRISSRRIYPEWLRFVLHAGALKRRGIPTVTILQIIRIPHLKRTGVIYRPLEGRTLRQVHASGDFDEKLAGRLGGFFAQLHRRGVVFRALHFGNVLLCPDGRFGLIDISDMKVFPCSLAVRTRMRNFVHLFRYPDDLRILTGAGIQSFIDGYLEGQASRRIKGGLQRICNQWISK